MKRNSIILFIFAGLFYFSSAKMLLYAQTQNEFVKFSIKNAGIWVDGQFDTFESKVTITKNDFSRSSFVGNIQVSSINTGIKMRDKHLKEKDYFDATKYPEITFKSTSVKQISSDKLEVIGNLTVKNTTKGIKLLVKLIEKNQVKYATTTFTINRLDFGIGEESWILDDVVKVSIQVVYP